MDKRTKQIIYTEYTSEEEIPKVELELMIKAREAALNSYSPHSNFQVGAAIRLDDGTVLTGSNQENAAYPSGLCAERVALFYFGANKTSNIITHMAVAAKRGDEEQYLPVTPCGACRQVMLEYENKQKESFAFIMKTDTEKWVKFDDCQSLLPFSFDENSL